MVEETHPDAIRVVHAYVKKVGTRQWQLSVGELQYGEFLMRHVAVNQLTFLDNVLADLRADGIINFRLEKHVDVEEVVGTITP